MSFDLTLSRTGQPRIVFEVNADRLLVLMGVFSAFLNAGIEANSLPICLLQIGVEYRGLKCILTISFEIQSATLKKHY